jgi:hypothetical protein
MVHHERTPKMMDMAPVTMAVVCPFSTFGVELTAWHSTFLEIDHNTVLCSCADICFVLVKKTFSCKVR